MLLRGESAVASVGLALMGVLVAALLACGGWLTWTQRDTYRSARHDQVAAVTGVLEHAAESLLADGRVTPVRRMLMDAADRHQLRVCRIVLPSGDVLAAATTDQITAGPAEADWSGKLTAKPALRINQQALRLARPLMIAGYGQARLEVEASFTEAGPRLWRAQAGVGAVGAGSLLVLLMVYRRFRGRLRAMGVVREALLARQCGEQSESALVVADDLGAEAAAWNRILNEHHELRQRAALDQTRAAPSGSREDSEVLAGCDAMAHGMIRVDGQMRIRYANNAAAVFLQRSREALTDADASDVFAESGVGEAIRGAVTGKVQCRATRELAGVGDEASVLRVNIYPVRHGERTSAMIVIDDITQQRVAESARHQFVAQASHELRTPLTNIRLYLDMLQTDDADASDTATQAQALNVINQETHRLDRLVGDMLSVAEIEAGSFQLRRDDVRIDALLNAARDDYRAQARDKGVDLQFKLPPKLPVVQGDRDKLMLTVQNLVGNAIKYTPSGGQVIVGAEASGGQLCVEVRDSGIGIAPEDMERVFDKFYRASDRRVTDAAGTGLGLALAREIVRLHGGDITVESQLDQGSTFTAVLPAADEHNIATEDA